jgi:WD40 repeat protein
VIDAVAGKKTHGLDTGGRSAGSGIAVSADGKTVAVPMSPGFGANQTHAVLLFDIESGKLKKALEGLSGTSSAIAFSPDGKLLITGSFDTTALVWDISGL